MTETYCEDATVHDLARIRRSARRSTGLAGIAAARASLHRHHDHDDDDKETP